MICHIWKWLLLLCIILTIFKNRNEYPSGGNAYSLCIDGFPYVVGFNETAVSRNKAWNCCATVRIRRRGPRSWHASKVSKPAREYVDLESACPCLATILFLISLGSSLKSSGFKIEFFAEGERATNLNLRNWVLSSICRLHKWYLELSERISQKRKRE